MKINFFKNIFRREISKQKENNMGYIALGFGFFAAIGALIAGKKFHEKYQLHLGRSFNVYILSPRNATSQSYIRDMYKGSAFYCESCNCFHLNKDASWKLIPIPDHILDRDSALYSAEFVVEPKKSEIWLRTLEDQEENWKEMVSQIQKYGTKHLWIAEKNKQPLHYIFSLSSLRDIILEEFEEQRKDDTLKLEKFEKEEDKGEIAPEYYHINPFFTQ